MSEATQEAVILNNVPPARSRTIWDATDRSDGAAPVNLDDVNVRLGKDSKFGIGFDLYYVFDTSFLPDNPIINSSELVLTVQFDSGGSDDHEARIFGKVRDGIWDAELGQNSTDWRGSNTMDIVSVVTIKRTTSPFQEFAVNDQNQDNNLAFISVNRFPIETGHTLGAVSEIAQYNDVPTVIDTEVSKFGAVLRRVGNPTGDIWWDIYTAQTGGGGQHNFMPDSFLASSDTMSASSVTTSDNGEFVNFEFNPDVADGGDHVFVFRHDYAQSTTNYMDVQVVGVFDGINQDTGNPDQDANMLLKGNARGLNVTSYIDSIQYPANQSGFVVWPLGSLTSFTGAFSPDIQTIVQAQADAAGFNDRKLMFIHISSSEYADGDTDRFFDAAAGIPIRQPRLFITYSTDPIRPARRRRVLTSP